MDFIGILVAGITAAVGITGASFALSAIGLNLQYGYTGLINFGHVGFTLVGAYGLAITCDPDGLNAPTWVGVLCGIAAAVVLALILGIPTLRLRGDYLAIVTIAAAEILRLLANSGWLEPLTGGPRGIQSAGANILELNPIPNERYGLHGLTVPFTDRQYEIGLLFSERQLWTMIIGWGLVAIALLATWRLVRSPWGRVIRAIRDDEDAVASVGKNVFAYKLQSLIVGGTFGALAGIVLAIDRQNVYPGAFLPLVTFYVYTIVILGGPGTVWGPVFGSFVFWALFQGLEVFLSQGVTQGWFGGFIDNVDVGAIRFALVGLALMLLMIFRPQGFFGSREEQRIDAR